MATYNITEIQRIVDAFEAGQDSLSNIDIDIVPEENTVDALEALRLYQGERNLDSGLRLATLLCVNRKVAFTNGTKILLEFTPAVGKPIQNYFNDAPYLLDVFISASWGILLKKLTPPSNGSETAGGR
jgi:hypothetical protein